MRGLDKITGRPIEIFAPVGVPVKYATLTITARYCYSTPPSEPPETTAFIQIEDHRPDADGARGVFRLDAGVEPFAQRAATSAL